MIQSVDRAASNQAMHSGRRLDPVNPYATETTDSFFVVIPQAPTQAPRPKHQDTDLADGDCETQEERKERCSVFRIILEPQAPRHRPRRRGIDDLQRIQALRRHPEGVLVCGRSWEAIDGDARTSPLCPAFLRRVLSSVRWRVVTFRSPQGRDRNPWSGEARRTAQEASMPSSSDTAAARKLSFQA